MIYKLTKKHNQLKHYKSNTNLLFSMTINKSKDDDRKG